MNTKAELKKWIGTWQKQIEAAQLLLATLNGDEELDTKSPKPQESAGDILNITIEKKKKEDGREVITLTHRKIKDWAVKYLTDNDAPSTTTEMYKAWSNETGSKKNPHNFANALSIFIRAESDEIKRLVVPGAKNVVKYWYYLPEWNEGGKLKDKYVQYVTKMIHES